MRKRFGVDDGRDVIQWSLDAMGQVFVLLAGCASFDVFGNPCPRARPEVFPVYLPDGLISSGVSTERPIVPRVHEFSFQSLIWRNDETVCLSVSPEWGAWGVYSFNGEGVLPFFHKGVMGVLDGGDGVF
jgi:hypothetical protein